MSVTIQGVKRVLVEVYGERVSPYALKEYAEEIYGDIFVEEYALDSIFGTVYRLETEELGEDFQSEAMYVFDGVIDLMENGEKTARRLYECFLGFHDFHVLTRLLNENSEWLTEEEIERTVKLAEGLYEKQALETSIWIFSKGGEE